MHFDLFTLYYLAIGTLLLSAALTLWEREARPRRSCELGVLAVGYAVLAIGCGLATLRSHLPVELGTALANIIMTSGYLLIFNGVAQIAGRRHITASIVLIVCLTCAWGIGGSRWESGLWSYVGAVPIAVVCGATALVVLRSDALRALRSRRIIVGASGGHAAFYAARACVLPVLVACFGPDVLSIAGKVTIYEGVLYSICLPMALLALVREEAHDQLLDASRTDYLTGLANRRWFIEQGERIIRDSAAKLPVSLLAFDLDHFKTINDRYGHAKGDDVLRMFAGVALAVTGRDAVLARTGGEEFVALLPGRDRRYALAVAQAVATRFAEAVADPWEGVGVEATVSIGLAELALDGTQLDALLSAADRALYLAKARGRNRIELAPSLDLAQAC